MRNAECGTNAEYGIKTEWRDLRMDRSQVIDHSIPHSAFRTRDSFRSPHSAFRIVFYIPLFGVGTACSNSSMSESLVIPSDSARKLVSTRWRSTGCASERMSS